MAGSRRTSAAPWVVAGVLGVVLVVLLVGYFALLRPAERDNSPGQLTSTEQDAVSAASTETVNLLSYRRAHFDADYSRGLAGTTGVLRTDVAGKRATTRQTLVTGKFDLSAKATHEALVGPAGKSGASGYVVLVTVNGYKSTQPNVPTQQNLQVTVVRSGGSWLLDNVQNVGIS